MLGGEDRPIDRALLCSTGNYVFADSEPNPSGLSRAPKVVEKTLTSAWNERTAVQGELTRVETDVMPAQIELTVV
jgi:hypothetical protein